MNVVTLRELSKNLQQVVDMSLDQYEPVVIRGRAGEDMIMLPLRAYESLEETAYLLGTKANAKHLRESLESSLRGEVFKKDLIEA